MKWGLKGEISIDADSWPLRHAIGMYFDAAVVFVTWNSLLFRLALAILWLWQSDLRVSVLTKECQWCFFDSDKEDSCHIYPPIMGICSVIVAVISELLTVLYLVFVYLEFFPILASPCCHLGCIPHSFTSRTTDAERGNSLHCTAENSLPLPSL